MLKLFAVLLGGRAEGCNIELHDVVFVVGNSLEETYPQLVNKWFGEWKRLHIDSSVELKYVAGHEVIINSKKPENSDNNLYFVNFGGYQPGYFGEIHAINFYVAASKTEAIAKAKRELCLETEQQHCDDNLAVEKLIDETQVIDDILAIQTVDKHYIHLQPTTKPAILDIQSFYKRLDVPDILERAKEVKTEMQL